VRAQFVITHSGGDLSGVLVARFGEHQPNVVDESLLLAQEPKAGALISYAHETLSYRLMAGSSTAPVLELFVEPKLTADLRDACQTVWGTLCNGRPSIKPRLDSLAIVDDATLKSAVEAQAGLGALAARADTISAFATMIVSVVWLVVGLAVFNATSDLILGAIPALVAGIVAGFILALDWKQNKLVWS
jgi:hypothetical protein